MAIVSRLNIENMLTTKYTGGGGAIIQGAKPAKPSLVRRVGLEIALKYSRQHTLPFPCPLLSSPQTQTLNICWECQYQCQFLETSKLPNTHLKR